MLQPVKHIDQYMVCILNMKDMVSKFDWSTQLVLCMFMHGTIDRQLEIPDSIKLQSQESLL